MAITGELRRTLVNHKVDLLTAFAKFDMNGDGIISADEFRVGFKDLDFGLTGAGATPRSAAPAPHVTMYPFRITYGSHAHLPLHACAINSTHGSFIFVFNQAVMKVLYFVLLPAL